MSLCQLINPVYWHFGAKITDENKKKIHCECLTKISVVRWFLKNPDARMGLSLEQHWINIKSQSGGLVCPSGMQDGATRRRSDSSASSADTDKCDLEYGLDFLTDELAWTEDDILEAWGDDMNKSMVCHNCKARDSHSALWCTMARRDDLPCQLCREFSHAEKDCVGRGHVTARQWRRLVREPFFKRIGGRRKPRPTGAAALPKVAE